MSHRSFVAILATLNLSMLMFLVLTTPSNVVSKNSCPYVSRQTRTVVAYWPSKTVPVIRKQTRYRSLEEVPKIHTGMLPSHLQDFVRHNNLACYSDGRHGLLAAGNQAVSYEDLYLSTALLGAAEQGNLRVVSMLLRNGANPDAMDCFGNTPLSLASSNAEHAVVDNLLRKGATATLGAWSW